MKNIEVQGVSIPKLGFGTFRMPGASCQPALENALSVGYRHIDTAAMYENEKEVGAAIAAAKLPRAELFVTTKVWHDQLAGDALRRAFDSSLSKLKLDYVDMYMIHWPSKGMNMAEVMEGLMALRREGLARSIGVCNFNMPMLEEAISVIGAPIAAVQVEYHPFLAQTQLHEFLRKHDIALTAYAPLAQGRAAQNETLKRIGAKHGVSAAEVAIAWLIEQEGVIAIPKAQRLESQRANLSAFDVRLDIADRSEIASLPKDLRYVQPPFAPDWNAKAL